MAYYWLLLLFRAKYKRSDYVPRPGNNAPLTARSTEHVSSTARQLSHVSCVGDWGKKFFPHAIEVHFNTQNEEWTRIIITRTIFPKNIVYVMFNKT